MAALFRQPLFFLNFKLKLKIFKMCLWVSIVFLVLMLPLSELWVVFPLGDYFYNTNLSFRSSHPPS